MENKELAIRILNFVMPYIPEHIKEEAMDIIKESYTNQTTKMENEITIKVTKDQAERILEAIKFKMVKDGGAFGERVFPLFYEVEKQIKQQIKL